MYIINVYIIFFLLLYMCSLAAWFVVVFVIVVVAALVLLWQQVRCLSLLFALSCGRHLEAIVCSSSH